MTTTQHTPGPWSTDGTKSFYVLHNGDFVANASTAANARLIAAAPELLELVLQAYDRFTDNDFMPPNHKLSLWLKKAEALFTITANTAATGEPTI